jgi:hypothetical protein
MSRLTVVDGRAQRALRDLHAANFPHRATPKVRQTSIDPTTKRETVTFTDGAAFPCRINPASSGGVNIAAEQNTVAGEWIVSAAWNASGFRERDRLLIQQGEDSDMTFAILVEINRILRPNTHEAVTTIFCRSVEVLG